MGHSHSIVVRLSAHTVAVVALLGLTWLGAVVSADRLRARYAHTVDTVDTLSAAVLHGATLRDDEETGVRGYLLTDRRRFLQPYDAARRAFPVLRHQQVLLAAAEPAALPLLRAQRRAGDAWDRWATGVLAHPTTAPRGAATLVAQQDRGKALFDRYRAATARVIARLDAARQADLRASVALLAATNRLVAALFIGATGLGLLLGWQATRAVTRPLAALRQAARAIGAGDLAHPVVVGGAREFVALAAEMDAMRGALAARDAALAAAQGELRAREEQVRTTYDAMACGVIVVDPDGVVVAANPAVAEVWGLPAAAVIGRPLAAAHGALVGEDGAALVPETRPTATARRTGRPVRGAVCHLTRHDGGERWIQVDAAPIFVADGVVRHVVTSFIDITARKAVEGTLEASRRELERSNAELAQFAYVASHDLQEPLRTITSYLQLLQRRYRGKVLDAGADEYMAFAIDGAKRMQALIQAVLAYSRVGTHGAAFAPVACRDLVEDAVATLGARIADTGARVAYDDLPTVRGDGAQLGQLVQNLIGNALKFHRPGGTPEVTITAARVGAEWTIAVRDNGIGIPPDQAARIFQMFQRLHTREEYEGTGIGLAVCKKIVERHGGRIWVESTPGEGATVLFTLPAHEADARGAREETAA